MIFLVYKACQTFPVIIHPHLKAHCNFNPMAISTISLPTSNPLPRYLTEDQDESSPEFKYLISSLPKANGWSVNHLYQYQGFWYPKRLLHGVLATQTLFQAQPTDLFLVTTPKSGTTWLKSMAFAIVNRESHLPHSTNHPLLENNPHELVPFLEVKLYVDNNVPDFTDSISPRLFATHMPYTSLPESIVESKCKVVYLCRNPKDTFVSLWHFVNKLKPETRGSLSLEEAFDRFCKGVSSYGSFWDHVLGYWKQSLEMPENILFLRYEEIKEEPKVCLRRLAEFLGCPFTVKEEKEGMVEEIQKLCSFENLSSLEVNKSGKLSSGEENNAYFRSGKVGDSANYLSPEMIEVLNLISEDKFRGFGLKL